MRAAGDNALSHLADRLTLAVADRDHGHIVAVVRQVVAGGDHRVATPELAQRLQSKRVGHSLPHEYGVIRVRAQTSDGWKRKRHRGVSRGVHADRAAEQDGNADCGRECFQDNKCFQDLISSISRGGSAI